MSKGPLEDLELGLRRPLAVFYLVGDVWIELSKVDERGIHVCGNGIWDAGVCEG